MWGVRRCREVRQLLCVAIISVSSLFEVASTMVLAYPEHQYTAQLQLIRGQLHMQIASRTDGFRRDDSYTAALTAFEAVVAAYAPVRDRFRELSANESDPRSYLQQIVYLEAGGREALPSFVLTMMRDDPNLERAVDVFADLGAQERDLAASERLVEELSTVLQDQQGLTGLSRVGVDASLVRLTALTLGLEALEVESDWLLDGGAPSGRLEAVRALASARAGLVERLATMTEEVKNGQRAMDERALALSAARERVVEGRTGVSQLKVEGDQLRSALGDAVGDGRVAAQQRLDANRRSLATAQESLAVDEAELARLEARGVSTGLSVDASLHEDIAEHHRKLEELRAGSGGAEGERIDRLFFELARAHGMLDNVDLSADAVAASETERVRARFDLEVAEVRAQRAELERARITGESVSVDLTRDGFGRLQRYFSDSVLKADSGIIDVYWAQKLQTADEINRVKKERTQLLQELEARFTLIRQKIGE